jgi:small-conductance mechanosensitive channel
MHLYYVKLIETGVIIALYLIARGLTFHVIGKRLKDKVIHESRGITIRKVLNAIYFFICAALILLIWGVNQSDLAIFAGSVLTVVGVAFFAQWSLLSNITSSIIIFFNHPVKLNDTVTILEGKDYILKGKVINIGLFFVTLEIDESETLTLPNNIFIQKSIQKQESKVD